MKTQVELEAELLSVCAHAIHKHFSTTSGAYNFGATATVVLVDDSVIVTGAKFNCVICTTTALVELF